MREADSTPMEWGVFYLGGMLIIWRAKNIGTYTVYFCNFAAFEWIVGTG